MASWLWKQLRTSVLIHKSVKFQIIDDPRVVVVAWLIKIGVVVYVSWALFFQFKYFKLEVPLGYTNIYATGFSKENAVPAGLCDGLPEYDFVYDELWSYLDNRCRPFTYGEVIRKLEGGGIYIQTYSQNSGFSKYSDCFDDGVGCRNETRTVGNFFVPHVDAVQLHVEHGYDAVAPRRGALRLDLSSVNPRGSGFEGRSLVEARAPSTESRARLTLVQT